MTYPPWKALIWCVFAVIVHPIASAQVERFGGALPEQYAPARVLDVDHVFIDVSVEPNLGEVDGEVTLDATLLRDTSEVVLLAGPMTISSIVYEGLSVAWRRRGERILISVPQSRSGRKVRLNVRYQAKPQRGMYFVSVDSKYPTRTVQAWTQGEAQDNRFWFPGWDYPNDRFTTEVRVSIPKALTALSNGRLVDDKVEGQRRVRHWKMDKRHVNYLVTLAIGQFIEQDLGTYKGRVELPLYVREPHLKNFSRSFDQMHQMLEFLEKYTGRNYPYGKYAQIVVTDFLWGGMENTTATTLTEHTIHDARAEGDWSSDGLIMHELAHQWFGDLITCNDWTALWLNEGFATYFESLYFEATRSRDEFDVDRVQSMGWYLHSSYWRPIHERKFGHPDDLFDGHTYGKAAAVMHMMREEMGSDVFRRGVQKYVADNADSLVEAHDLRRAMEAVSGLSLGSFFAQWVNRAGHPKVSFDWRWNGTQNMLSLDIEQTQDAEAYHFTLPITVHVGDSVSHHRVLIHRKSQTVSLPFSTAPDCVEADPRRHVLMERFFEKSAKELAYQMLNGTSAVSRRWAVDESGMYTEMGEREIVRAALLKVIANEKEHHTVRKHAAGRLAYGADMSTRGILLRYLKKERNSRVRAAVAAALGEYNDGEVASALKRAFGKDDSYKVSAAALTAYAATGARDTLAMARRALKVRSHREVVAIAALGILTQRGGADAKKSLQGATIWGQPHLLRRAAARELGRFGKNYPKFADEIVEHLETLLADPLRMVAMGAVDGLRTLKHQGSLQALRSFAERSATRTMRRKTLEAIQVIHKASRSVREEKMQERLDDLDGRLQKLDDRLRDIESR